MLYRNGPLALHDILKTKILTYCTLFSKSDILFTLQLKLQQNFKKNLNVHRRFSHGVRPCLSQHHATRSARAMKETVHFIVHCRSSIVDSIFRSKLLGPLGGSINMLSISLYFTLRTRVYSPFHENF